MRRWRHIRARRGAFWNVTPPPAVIPPAIPRVTRQAGSLRAPSRLLPSSRRSWGPPWLPPPPVPPPQFLRPAGSLRFAARLLPSRRRWADPAWPQAPQGQPWPSFTRQPGTRARFATRQSRGRPFGLPFPAAAARAKGERQMVRLAVAAYFGGSLVTADAGTCFQGGPLTAYGLGTAYPYSVKGVPDSYYQAGQPAG